MHRVVNLVTMYFLRVFGAAWCVAATSLACWICAGVRAAHRPFWFDELETRYLAMPTISDLWKAICAGSDQNVILAISDGGWRIALRSQRGNDTLYDVESPTETSQVQE